MMIIKRRAAWIAAVVLAVCILSAGTRAETENTPGSAAGETAAESGAASLDELKEILGSGFLFTEQKVNCMGQEFLLACISVCDPENAQALFEERDCAKIASLLNDRFFQAAGVKPLRYKIVRGMEYELTDEMRQQTQDFFMNSRDLVVAQYGEYFFQKVSEENAGRQRIVLLIYTTEDEDGVTGSGPDDITSGLCIAVVSGRYYWNDFSLFRSVAGQP